jgi:hypothetical protein
MRENDIAVGLCRVAAGNAGFFSVLKSSLSIVCLSLFHNVIDLVFDIFLEVFLFFSFFFFFVVIGSVSLGLFDKLTLIFSSKNST